MNSTTVDLTAFVNSAGDAIIAADGDGTIVLWNPAAERIFGFRAQEALGRSLDIIIPERFRERHWHGYRTVMRTGQSQYGTEVLRVPARHRDGHDFSIAFTVALLPASEGGVGAIVAIARDETARWNEERAMRQRLKDLEQQIHDRRPGPG